VRKEREGEVFHAYSCSARSIDMVNGAYHVLDLVPKAAIKTASNSRWSACASTISTEALGTRRKGGGET
jgi:predicted dithiol-disulfide oxidoreductase (DUF899 family)